MPRWESGTRERLERAALDLFADRGYDAVTVQDIADRAGTAKATFFRTFPDKREVLFWGQDLIADLLTEGVANAPAGATPAELLASALRSVASAFPADRHALAPVRQRIVAAHPDLLERRAFKRAALEAALLTRDVPAPDAAIAAEIGRAAYSAAYAGWALSDRLEDFAAIAAGELAALLEAAGRVAAV